MLYLGVCSKALECLFCCFWRECFCLDHLCIDINGVVKFPTITVLLIVSMFVNICFIYLGTPVLGAFITVVYSY